MWSFEWSKAAAPSQTTKPNSQESLDLPGFHGRRVSERLHLIDLDGDLTSLGHSTSARWQIAFEFESFYLFQIQNLVLTSSFDFWTSFCFFSKLRQSSWHWASTGWRRWPCRRLGSTAALSAGLELGFCEKSNITSTQQIWKFGKKQFAFIFIHFHSFFHSFSFPLWHHLWDLYGFVWICGMSNVQILRWVMCGQSSLTTFARMALQDHNLVIFELRTCDICTWYRWYSSNDWMWGPSGRRQRLDDLPPMRLSDCRTWIPWTRLDLCIFGTFVLSNMWKFERTFVWQCLTSF